MLAKHFVLILLFFMCAHDASSQRRIIPKKEKNWKVNSEDDNFEEDVYDDDNVITPPKKNEKLRPPSCGVVLPPCNPTTTFRTYDGSCNNLQHPTWGLPNSTYSRLLPPRYNDGIKSPRRAHDSTALPGARRVRTSLFPVGEQENTLWNINIMIWGQFMAHDMSLLKQPDNDIKCCPRHGGAFAKGGSKHCFPIKIPKNDPTQGAAGIRCMNFTRTVTDRDLGCSKKNTPVKQINAVSSYLDLSNVYGNDKETADSLRSFIGGKMKVEVRNSRIYPPNEPNKKAFCSCNLNSENTCYASGDSRTNQNPHLAILQILFVREHNRLASSLSALNPAWNDERLYQEARRINIAQYQRISYYEWLPILLKRPNLTDAGVIYNETGFINDYNPSVSPDISNEHAHGAYRHFHTQIVGMLRLMSAQRTIVANTTMAEFINRPGILELGSFMEQFTVGLLTQPTGETDSLMDEQMSDRLFSCRNEGFGIDLKATDIQRDRDHALAYYNDYRRLFGMNVANSFDDYKDLIPSEKVEILKLLYKSHEDVDLTVGGSLESVTVTSPQVGPTFMNILLEQFRRSRVSDRFWYENESSGLTLAQLTEIRKATVSRLFCDNADGITEIQARGFNFLRGTNVLVPCNTLNVVDLTKWQA